MPGITRRESFTLMQALYALAPVAAVTPVTSETKFLIITIGDGIEFDSASIKNMKEELDDVIAKSNCPNLSVLALYGGKVHAITGPMIPEEMTIPGR